MPTFPIHQALFIREGNAEPVVRSRSAAFADDWVTEARSTILAFGNRPWGVSCPYAVFARPLELDQVAVVQVADRPEGGLAFHFLVLQRSMYERFLGDPFVLAKRFAAKWEGFGELPTLGWPLEPLPQRTVEQVRRVLKRLKPHAVAQSGDHNGVHFERTAENSESPALLGAAQVLVEGGRVVFERAAPDTDFLESLWTLLPTSTRNRLWPASFAFGNQLGFDALIVPHAGSDDFEGYIHEQEAIEYPEGHFELNLQIAAEAGDQEELDALFARSNPKQIWQLVLTLLVVVMLLSLVMHWDKLLLLFQAIQQALRVENP